MSKAEKSLRDQLLEARAEVLRQIEILQTGPLVSYPGDSQHRFDEAIAELTKELKDIDDSLTGNEC
jgi:hypothetical protein